MKNSLLLLFAFVYLLSNNLLAVKTLYLTDLIDLAEKRNLELKMEKIKIKKLWIEEKKANNLFIPDLRLSLQKSRTEYLDSAQEAIYGKTRNNIVYSVSMNQTYYALGKGLILKKDIAKFNTGIQKNMFYNKKLDIYRAVVTKFCQMVREKRKIVIYKEIIGLAQKLLEIAKINQQVGLTLFNDVLRIEVQKRNFEVSLLMAENMFKKLYIDMGDILNISNMKNYKIIIPDNVDYYKPFNVENPNWTSIMLKKDYDLKLKKIQYFMYKKIYRTAKSAYLPNISISGQYNVKPNSVSYPGLPSIKNSRDYSVALSLDAPIYDSGDLIDEIRKAKKDLESIKLEKQQITNIKISSLKKNILDYAEAVKRISTDKKSVEQSRENMRLIMAKYKAGDSSITELIDAQLTLTSSLLQILNGFYDERIKLSEIFLKIHDFKRLRIIDRRFLK